EDFRNERGRQLRRPSLLDGSPAIPHACRRRGIRCGHRQWFSVYSKLLLAFRIKSLGTYGRLMFRSVSTQPVASVPQFSRGEISKAQNRLVLANSDVELPIIDFEPRLIASFAHLGRTTELVNDRCPTSDPHNKTVRGYNINFSVQCSSKFLCPQLSTALKSASDKERAGSGNLHSAI